MKRVAWVLNLDAEDELARGGPHTPTQVMTERIESLLPRLAGLIRPGDCVLWPGDGAVEPGMPGRAWCPTPWALSQMERAGVRRPPAPSQEVLRNVNHRRFAHALGQALPGAGYADDAPALAALLADTGTLTGISPERSWLIKRPLGYAGRGRKKLAAGEISAADQAWLEASLRTGDGLQVEPFVERVLDCALHGVVEPDGQYTLGQPTVQHLDAWGAWESSALAPPGALTDPELEALHTAARQTAVALYQAGYFGPFGLDGFRWRSTDGALHFQPRSEVNARYSMGWAVGFSRG